MAQAVAIVLFGLAFFVAAYGLLFHMRVNLAQVLNGAVVLLLMGNLIAVLRVGNLLEDRFKRR